MTSLSTETTLDEFHAGYPTKALCKMAFAISRKAPAKRTQEERQSLASIHRVLEDRHNLKETMDRFAAGKQPYRNWTEILIGAIPKQDRE